MSNTSRLFEPLTLRGVTLRNRIGLSPMDQYSSLEGLPQEWHLVHYGARASGGVGLVIVEATAVEAIGRISPGDCGLWDDLHVEAFMPVTEFVHCVGAVPGVQLAHAGRKAATAIPWKGSGPLSPDQGGWTVVGPSPVPFSEGYPVPHELTEPNLEAMIETWVEAAHRAQRAGFRLIELHMAHGYLLNSFLSPLSNRREDCYGGSLENRMRFPLALAGEVRRVWPEELPMIVRISATDWIEGGWDLEQSITFAGELKKIGVDLIDCSSAGILPLPEGTPYDMGKHREFSARIRREADIATATVGEITEPSHAEAIITDGMADMVLLGRELLRNPTWPIRAARELGADPPVPNQYLRT